MVDFNSVIEAIVVDLITFMNPLGVLVNDESPWEEINPALLDEDVQAVLEQMVLRHAPELFDALDEDVITEHRTPHALYCYLNNL